MLIACRTVASESFRIRRRNCEGVSPNARLSSRAVGLRAASRSALTTRSVTRSRVVSSLVVAIQGHDTASSPQPLQSERFGTIESDGTLWDSMAVGRLFLAHVTSA